MQRSVRLQISVKELHVKKDTSNLYKPALKQMPKRSLDLQVLVQRLSLE